MVTVCFETLTEAETFPAGVVGRVVWVPFSLNLTVWGANVDHIKISAMRKCVYGHDLL